MRDLDDGDDDAPAAPRDWLTYRYRLGGSAEAAGTIKAPSFSAAARRLLDGRLADRVGPEPAWLRLRAAGQEEVLLRVWRDAGGLAHTEPAPADGHRFEPPAGLPGDPG